MSCKFPILEQLTELLNRYREREWFRELALTDYLLELEEIRESLEGYKPQIAVIGEFSAGKSTFINSLLGKQILPEGFAPTTRHFIRLVYGEQPILLIDGKDGEVKWERVKELAKGTLLELHYPSPILKKVIFIDTPGSNDPTFKTEGRLLQLMEQVDLVIFIFNATQALKESERLFLSQLITRKERDKFLFLLNWIDGVSNPRQLKMELLPQLAELMEWGEEETRRRLFLYSAREVLEGKRRELGELFSQKLLQFIEKRERELANTYLRQTLRQIVGELKLKLEGYLTQLEQGDRGVVEELKRLKEEQGQLERELERELNRAEELLERSKGETILQIREELHRIKKELEGEIYRLDRLQLTESRYLELRFRKLVEDRVEQILESFLSRVGEIIENIDSQISKSEVVEVARLSIPYFPKGSGLKKVGGILALIGISGGVGVETYLTISTFPSIATFLGTVGIGTGALIPVAGLAGILTGALFYKLGKWGKNRLGGITEGIELGKLRKRLMERIEHKLLEVEGELIIQLKRVEFRKIKEEYLRAKFPKRHILEEQLNRLERLRERSIEENRIKIEEVKKLKTELELVYV